MARKLIVTELDTWQLVHGESEESIEIRAIANRRFTELFPRGHRESLRSFVAEIAWYQKESGKPFPKDTRKLLKQFHPNALELLVQYGISYRPYQWKKYKPELFEHQPILNGCSLNSANLMRLLNHPSEVAEHVYVEGMSVSSLSFPMLHAWNAKGITGRVALDWSNYSTSPWTRYLGIPLTQEEHEKAAEIAGYAGRAPLLLDRRVFPKVEPYLREILEKRSLLKSETK